jgi:hypothetical protein
MDKKIIQSYLWNDIIQIGFKPSNLKEQKNWLYQYSKSLPSFWETDDYPDIPKYRNDEINFNIDCIKYNILIENCINYPDKYSTLFYFSKKENKELMWLHDVDHEYFSFPINDFLVLHNQRTIAINSFDNKDFEEDVESVIQGLLLHPAVHQHIESPITNHKIRIGGGISNRFLFLFHLRYQFCPDSDRRIAEKNRLVYLFSDAIKNKKNNIPVNELMKVPN